MARVYNHRVRLRETIGALVYDWPPFALHMLRGDWLSVRNRDESIERDGRGVRCEWQFGNQLHIANVLPATGKRLMRVALERWPIAFAEEPWHAGTPAVTFVIGHRGLERLPHLLTTLRTIAAQSVAVECVVVEQSHQPEIASKLPAWVKYLHTAVRRDAPFSRSQTFQAAVAHAQSGILILHDNDMLMPAAYAAEAVARAAEGWRFANLKRFIFYLPAYESGRVFATGSVRPSKSTIVQNVHGGSIVAERTAYEAIGGYDQSFIGWGGEDNDFWDRAATTDRIYDFGYLPMIHLHHEDQPGKRARDTAAIARYEELRSIPPRERIARLRSREQGRDDAPSAG
jgi:hypothetical protein